MFDAALAGLTLATLLLGVWMLRYGGSSPTAWFFLSWVLSSFAIFVASFEDAYPILASTYLAHGTMSAALLFGGILVLLRRAVPAWFLPATVSYGFARAALAGFGQHDLALLLGLPLAALAGSGGVLAIRDRPPQGQTRALRLLGGVLVVVCSAALASVLTRVVLDDPPPELLYMWPFLATLLLAVQLYAVAEHRANEQRLRQDEQRLRHEELERLVAERAGEIARIDEFLRESEQRYRAVSELSSDFSFSLRVDPERGIEREWVTEAFERITGHPPHVLDGDGWATLLRGETGPASDRDREMLESLEDEATIQYRFERPDGGVRWLEVVLRVERGGEDDPTRVLGAARDVTEAHDALETRRELERRIDAAERMESLGMLAGGIAHDFNNLLAVIQGNTRLVRDELPSDSPLAAKLANVQAAAEDAARLTEQMLTYSGKAIVSLAPIEISGLMDDLGGLLRASVGPACALRIDAGETGSIEGDPTRLSQVILNLVTNAHEALPDGHGHVTLRTGRGEVDGATLASATGSKGARPGPYAWLEVTDDGCGMDEETSRRIFEPFYTTKFSGRGLGLASVLGIVRAHGGLIDLRSEPGRGTRVRVLIPSSDRDPDSMAPAASVGPVPQRVLVVDDDEAVLELAGEFLRRAGYECHRAAGGLEAIDLFTQKSADIDVVVLDLTMPDLDGREVFQELRSIRSDIPVVLATGYSRGTLEENFPGESRISFLRKPYEPEELLAAIDAARAPADD